MDMTPPNKSNSYPNKMSETNTINFSVRLYSTFQRELDFDDFCEKFMEQWDEDEMRETDKEFYERCRKAWSKIWESSDGDYEFDDEEDECDGDERVVELSDEYINDRIYDPLVDKYDEIVSKRFQREREERENKKREDALKECVRKMNSIITTQEEKEKAERVAKLRAELRSLGEIC
jgi:hypothetical protein